MEEGSLAIGRLITPVLSGEWPSNKLIRRRNKDTFYWGPGGEHKLFARGTVLAVEGHEDSAKLTIEFGKKISKVIVSKYVKLVKK